jgi:hypothetical protein
MCLRGKGGKVQMEGWFPRCRGQHILAPLRSGFDHVTISQRQSPVGAASCMARSDSGLSELRPNPHGRPRTLMAIGTRIEKR